MKSESFYNRLKELDPDIIVLGGGWHELLPPGVYNYPKLGCVNTHPSLLPEFRGTSITRWQILYGVEKSGTSIHFVDETFDTGGILIQEEIEVGRRITPQELFHELGLIGADAMCRLLARFEQSGKQEPVAVARDGQVGDYFRRWKWDEKGLHIDWTQRFEDIHNFVRANTQESYEYLGPIATIGGKKFFVRATDVIPLEELGQRDQILSKYQPDCGDSEIQIIKLKDGHVYLHRAEERSVLVIKVLQRYDRFYKVRRAHRAQNLLNLEVGQVLRVRK